MKNYTKITPKITAIVAVTVISLFVFGCEAPKITVKDTQSPMQITKGGTFVTEEEYYSLIDGKNVKQRLTSKVGDYYLPENLITVKSGSVTLFSKK